MAPLSDLRPAATLAAINAYAEEQGGGGLQCRLAKGKGRVLVATRSFEPGEVLLVEPPLHAVREEPGNEAFDSLNALCAQWEDAGEDVQWYWYGLRSLTEEELGGPRGASRPPLEERARQRLLLLHEGGAGSSRPSRRTAEVARRLAPRLRDAGVLERCMQGWKLNAFDYSDDDRGLAGAALYFLPSFMSHSCLPSAVWHIDGGDSYVLRARRTIAAGDEVSVTYLDENALLDHAAIRRRDLFESKEFWCACERCTAAQDKSRGFRCPACQQGSVFARAPGCEDLPDGHFEDELETDSEEDDEGTAGRPLWLARSSGSQPGKCLRLLARAACASCGFALPAEEAALLVEVEAELQVILARWRADGKHFSAATADVDRAEQLMERHLTQHSASHRARKFLARHYRGTGERHKQLSALQARVEFSKAAYPGISAAHAWALEAYADALADADLGMQRRGKCPEEAAAAYLEALRILTVMFGPDHEYVQDVEAKLSR